MTSHAPILISGDSGFTSVNGVVAGTGVRADPYMIDGWIINSTISPSLGLEPLTSNPFFSDAHLILRNQMASNTLVKRLLWVYGIFTLYVIVASLLGVAGVVYLPLRMDIVLLFSFLALYWTVIAQRIIVRRQKKRATPTKPW
jgi:pilus assembly protein TadC